MCLTVFVLTFVAYQKTVRYPYYMCMCVCLYVHVCIVGVNRILLSSSQLCPADESQEAPACVCGYYVEASA